MGELAPQLRAWLEGYNRRLAMWRARGLVQTPASVRDGMARLTNSLRLEEPSLPLVQDAFVVAAGHSVPVRIYHRQSPRLAPVLVYLHGGGHVAGSLEIYDSICRKIALATGYLVIGVEYRLAPEHPYPAGLEDARAVITGYAELLARLELPHEKRLAVVGDSAGGAMAASLAHILGNAGQNDIDSLVLLYPGLDYTLSCPSVEALGAGYLLEKPQIRWYFEQYLQNDQDRKVVSPLFMPVPASFPRTLLVSAGFCPLRDEAFAYCRRLHAGGVAVHHVHCPDMIHAFLGMDSLVPRRCRMVYRALADFLTTA